MRSKFTKYSKNGFNDIIFLAETNVDKPVDMLPAEEVEEELEANATQKEDEENTEVNSDFYVFAQRNRFKAKATYLVVCFLFIG